MPETKKILIVEDDQDVGLLVQLLLNEQGYQTRIETQGDKALGTVGSFSPDLILLDVMLPGMDGIQICQALKGNRSFRKIPVVVLTALNRIADQERALSAGADDFIGKPFDTTRLIQKIAKNLAPRPA